MIILYEDVNHINIKLFQLKVKLILDSENVVAQIKQERMKK